jgi:4-carboxymuconolactone decarboxylase
VDRQQQELLRRLALNDERALESVLHVSVTNGRDSGLDAKTQALVRLAGLVALESASASYAWSVDAALAAGADEDEIVAVLVAVAPLVGVARVNRAAPEVAAAIGCDLGLPAGGPDDAASE